MENHFLFVLRYQWFIDFLTFLNYFDHQIVRHFCHVVDYFLFCAHKEYFIGITLYLALKNIFSSYTLLYTVPLISHISVTYFISHWSAGIDGATEDPKNPTGWVGTQGGLKTEGWAIYSGFPFHQHPRCSHEAAETLQFQEYGAAAYICLKNKHVVFNEERRAVFASEQGYGASGARETFRSYK